MLADPSDSPHTTLLVLNWRAGELPLAMLDEKLGVTVLSEEVAKITVPNWPGYSRTLDL
jgi:hypothetical protein